MNIALVADFENGAAIDPFGKISSQRARELLGSITTKREALEHQLLKADRGTIVRGLGRSIDAEDIVPTNKPTTTTKQPALSTTLATKFQQALRDKRNRLRKHLRVDDDHQDSTQTTDTSTSTPLVSPRNVGLGPIDICVTKTLRLISIGRVKPPPSAVVLHSSMSWDEGSYSPITVSKLLRKTQSFDGGDHGHALGRRPIETITNTNNEQALRAKRNRLRKHLGVDDFHQDNTQTTDTSTTTPLVSPRNVGFGPIEICVTEAPRLISIGKVKPSPGAVELHSSMSWDKGQCSPMTVSKLLRNTQSFDGGDHCHSLGRRLIETITNNELLESAAHPKPDSADHDQPLVRAGRIGRILTSTAERSPRRNRRSKSLESNDCAVAMTPLIKLSLSLDRGLSKSLVAPRGDRLNHGMTFSDIEVPLEISTLDACRTKPLQMTKCTSRRTGSNIIIESTVEESCNTGCTLPTTEARVEYIDKLYHASSMNQTRTVRTSNSEKRKERAKLNHEMIRTHQEETRKASSSTTVIAVGHNYNTTSSNGEELMKLSLTDSCDRREMLRRLQLDLNRPKLSRKLSEAVRKAAIVTNDDSSTEECFPLSDDSSCDFTTSSETISIGSLSSTLYTIPRKAKVRFAEQLSSVSRMTRPSPTRKSSSISSSDIFRTAGHVLAGSKTSRLKPLNFGGPLVIDPNQADQRCQASGGLFDLATKSGLDQVGDVPLKRLGGVACVRPQIQLSTDFRCGTYGSLYDIALRSGCFLETTKPRMPSKTTQVPSRKTKLRPAAVVKTITTDPRYIPARGSLYDVALQSGLTKEIIRTRSSFSFTVKHSSKGTKACMVLPSESDSRCGACGSLYLAATCIDKRVVPSLTPIRLH